MTPQPLKNVAVVVDNHVSPFEFAIACEVFGLDRQDVGLDFDFRVCSPDKARVRVRSGFWMEPDHDLSALADADLIVVPAISMDYQPGDELVRQLWAAVDRGAQIMSFCTGSFILARAGLLDGRRATTHWLHTDELAEEFPRIRVVPDVLFVEDGPILTSAGTAAGIDLCLHVIRRTFGGRIANAVARRMVVPPQREGGQAQFVTTPVPDLDKCSLSAVLDWAQGHLDQEITVAEMAERAGHSERTFARRFRDETGTTPHQWVLTQRIARAEQLLESGDHSIEEVAELCGFASATMLRHHFRRLRGTSPTQYRRTFSVADEPVA